MDEERLKQMMDAYADARMRADGMRSERQTVFDTIIARHPEIANEIEDAKFELDSQIKKAEEQEETFKKILDMAIEQYGREAPIKDKLTLKSDLLTVSFTKKVEYDATALDGMAISNPTLLGFRKEKITSRTTLKKM
jgi:hypothetical protein